MEKFIYNLIPDKRQPGDFVRNGAYFYLSCISNSPNAGERQSIFVLPCRKGKMGLYSLEEGMQMTRGEHRLISGPLFSGLVLKIRTGLFWRVCSRAVFRVSFAFDFAENMVG